MVLGYDTATTVNLSTSVIQPAACQTTSYVAGANEAAVMSMDLTVLSSTGTNLSLMPMFVRDALASAFAAGSFAMEQLPPNGWTSLHHQAMLALVAGSTYRFQTGVKTDTTVINPQFTCRGLVMIVEK